MDARSLKLLGALKDRVSGLPAVALLIDDLRAMLDRRRFLGVLAVEIDGLQELEAVYGWQLIDRIVARAAAMIGSRAAELDPCRLAIDRVAGDRLFLFVGDPRADRDVDPVRLSSLANELLASLDGMLAAEEFQGLDPHPCFRVGQSLLSEDPFYRFERRVYGALDEALASSRRREQRDRRSWGRELQQIIDDGGVRPVFQPMVDLTTGEVHGFEALARGRGPGELVEPRALFRASRELGCDVELDRVCREAALADYGRAGYDRRLFVNVLADSLDGLSRDGDEAETWLARRGVQAEGVVFELSERSAEQRTDELRECVDRLSRRGFAWALDDVGTGYATGSTLAEMRPDYVKIDSAIVRDLDSTLIKQEVVRSLVASAERIGAPVVAEGIETRAEAEALVECGIRLGQGFLFGSPERPRGAGERS